MTSAVPPPQGRWPAFVKEERREHWTSNQGPSLSSRLTPQFRCFFSYLNFFGSIQGVTELLDEFPGQALPESNLTLNSRLTQDLCRLEKCVSCEI